MIQLNRRHLFAGTAATTAALSTALTPRTCAPPRRLAGKQAPGFYRYKVGDFEVTHHRRRQHLPVAGRLRDQPEERGCACRGRSRLHAEGPDDDPVQPVRVNTGSKLVVIDTGTGEAPLSSSKGAAGQFKANLKAAGIDPKHGRHRRHLAFPRRPHQRPADGRRRAGLSERRDHGAGRRMGFLDRRRRMPPRRRLQEGRISPDVQKVFDGLQGHAVRSAARMLRRVSDRDRNARPHARPHRIRDLSGRASC